MAVRPDYKQTEVGVIPNDWEAELLPAVAWFQEGPGLRKWQFTTRGIKVINITNLENGYLNLDRTDRHISKEELDRSYRHFLVDSGDIVVASSGNSFCKVAVVRDQDLPLVMNTSVIRFKPLESLDYTYLLIFLNSLWFKRQIDLLITGGAQPNFGPFHLKKIRIQRPPLPEQKAIAAVLSDVDTLLAKLDQIITKKRDLKQASMQQLLTGQIRLPGFSGEWNLQPLGYVVANLEAGVSVNSVEHSKPLSSDEPCILKTSAIFDGRFDPEECKLIDRRDINRAKLSPRRDTIIISRMNTPNLVGEVGYVPRDFPTLNLPDRLWMTRFDPGADICPRWLAYAMCSTGVKEVIKGLATGTSGSMKNIAKSALLAMQLAFPSGTEQTAIATVLSDMDTELAALEARRDKTYALKQGMMQELLTGRIRLI